MSSLQKRKSNLTTSNPITSDKSLSKLLDETKDLDSEEAFTGWKESFLEQYKKFLDPAGVENAEASNGRLVRSLERLAKSVITVNGFVKDGKITTETQSVQGKRHLTNMTEQMAETEKEVARFMPSTGAEEAKMGYDKFELGAVMIEDGFHVYEHLKTTKDTIERLQELVLNEVLPSNKQSIIQYYLRQVQTFCDVMADLGLFGLMERLMEIYSIKPRSKTKPVKEAAPEMVVVEEEEEPEKPERVLDPNVKYNRRSAYTNGYFDPFSGTQPGKEEFEDPSDEDDDQDGEGEDDENHFIIYFDMKTGTIGKIPRDVCRSSNFIVGEDDKGNEQMQGEIDDDAEKEQLIWDMKKAMKSGGSGAGSAAPRTSKKGTKRNKSPKSNAGGPTESGPRVSKDRPKRAVSAKAKMESNGDGKPFVGISEKVRSNSVRSTTPELDEDETSLPLRDEGETSAPLRGLRGSKSGSLVGTSRSPGALSKPPRTSSTKSPGALSSKPRLSRATSDESSGSKNKTSTKSPGALSSKPRVSRTESGDGLPTMSPGALSTKSPGALSRKPRVSRTKSGDGLPTMSPGALSAKPRIARSSSSKVERTPLEGNNKLAKAAPSSSGWATPSKLATKRRGAEDD
jgi:hypothetical protein